MTEREFNRKINTLIAEGKKQGYNFKKGAFDYDEYLNQIIVWDDENAQKLYFDADTLEFLFGKDY